MKVDYKKAWKELEEWIGDQSRKKSSHPLSPKEVGYGILKKMTEIRKQCTKREGK